MLIKLDIRSYYYTLAGSLCPDRGSRVRKSIPDQDWAVWQLVIGADLPGGGLHPLCHRRDQLCHRRDLGKSQWLSVPLLVASKGFVQEEGIEFSMGLASEGSSLYILCYIISQLYMYIFSFELQSCCVAQGNLKLWAQDSHPASAFRVIKMLGEATMPGWGLFIKRLSLKTPIVHICVFTEDLLVLIVCVVCGCVCRDTCVTQVRWLTPYPPASTRMCWNYRCLPPYNRFNACLLCAF